ncbi:transcriptional regulator [Mycolicibacterium pallens]|uniref:TetR/AcrR family transcriptional regulator n=1 Tax=Mycolicibacterium pallens TaxID=370524 RepID=A0ABX8VLJ8_9MYCO|nr:transcriptional regulator [Mycolicibacterium pallens]QYL16973.1 TetR/AcrR family transcriptional regulator [Mycolicibacterium pallens]
MPAAQRSYGGRTADARRTARQASLRETALDIMAANEWRTATVDKVCAAAGLNKRYFYESFTDLDALAAAVVDAIADDVREATLAAVAGTEGQPLEYQAFVGVSAAVRTLVEDPRRARVLLGGVAASSAFLDHRVAVMHDLTGVLIEHGRRVHDVALERDPLAKVAPAFIVGGSADAILAWVNGAIDVTLDELIAQLATLWLITGNGAAEIARGRA